MYVYLILIFLIVQEPLAVARAKTLLERAAGAGHLPAVYLLVDLLEREGAQDKAVTLIKVNSRLHMKTRFYKKNNLCFY